MADEIDQLGTPGNPTASALTGAGTAERSGFDRTDWRSFAATALFALVIYLLTLAPDVTLTNTGYFATAAKYAGVPSPPGYPLWTIYSWFFTRLLPFSNIAWRVSVGSAVAAALASGIVALIVSRGTSILTDVSTGFGRVSFLDKARLRFCCGCVAGMALGLSGPVWRKAVIPDVWTLGLLLFTTILCVALRWLLDPRKGRFLCAGFWLLGALLTSNEEMIVALPGLVLIAMLGDCEPGRDLALTVLPLARFLTKWNGFGIWINYPRLWNRPSLIVFAAVMALGVAITAGTRRFGSTWKLALRCNICFFLGLLLWLYLPASSMTNPPMNWGYPRTVEGFFHVLSRGQYERVNPTGDIGQYVNQLWLFTKMCGREWEWPYLVLAAVALFKIPIPTGCMRKWLLSLVVLFLCAGPVLVAELNPSSDRASQELLEFYFMPSFAALSILAGLGLSFCCSLPMNQRPIRETG